MLPGSEDSEKVKVGKAAAFHCTAVFQGRKEKLARDEGGKEGSGGSSS